MNNLTMRRSSGALLAVVVAVATGMLGCGPMTPASAPVEESTETDDSQTAIGVSKPAVVQPGPVTITRWDCVTACGRTGVCPQPGGFFGRFEGGRSEFENRFGCSRGIDFKTHRVYAFAAGGSNAVPHLDEVHASDSGIEVRLTVNANCNGAESYHREIFVLLLPMSEKPIELKSNIVAEDCTGRSPP